MYHILQNCNTKIPIISHQNLESSIIKFFCKKNGNDRNQNSTTLKNSKQNNNANLKRGITTAVYITKLPSIRYSPT